MVLFPDQFRLTRSLRKTLRSGRFEIRFDSNFAGVIGACAADAAPRPGRHLDFAGDDERLLSTA